MKKISRILSCLLIGCMVVGMLVGCGTKEVQEETSSSGTKEVAEEKSDADTKEVKEGISGKVNYVSMWNEGEPQAEVLKAIGKSFEEETGVNVEFEFAGRDVLTKIRSRLLMDDAPDLVDQDLSELNGALMKDGEALVMPITDFFKEKGPEGNNTMMDVFNEDIVRLYESHNELYYMPYSYITSGFFYDKNLYNKYQLTAPKTWDEFIKNNEKLKAGGVAPLALDGNISFYNAYYYYWAITRVLGKGALFEAAGDKTGSIWDDEGYLKAAQMVYELSKADKNHFQDGYEGSNYPAGQSDWALGKSGSILCGSWIPVETKDIGGEAFEFGFFPFPTVKGGKGEITDVEAYLIGCAIPKDAPNLDAAKEFLRFMVKKENAKKYADDTLNISARTDVEYPTILKDIKPVVDGAKQFHLSYDAAMARYSEWFANVFYPADNALVFGDITPEEFIEQIKKESAKYWESK